MPTIRGIHMENKITYRNASALPQSLANVGLVQPGQVVEVEGEINNPNFVKVDTRRFINVEARAEQPKVKNKAGVEKPQK